jgi:hypothetical protein
LYAGNKLPIEKVPIEVRRAHPSQYGLDEVPSAVQPMDMVSQSDDVAIEEDLLKRKRSNSDEVVLLSTESNANSCVATVDISCAENTSNVTNEITIIECNTSIVDTTVTNSTISNTSAQNTKKIKKRIAPVLIGALP